jgi:hypothetical protein
MLAVSWYPPLGLFYRDVEELLAERGVEPITPLSTAGCCGARRCWPMPPDPAATWSATAGSPTRPM